MNWTHIFEIAISCLVGVGGVGVVFFGLTKWTSDIIAERLSKKYQLQLEKEIEKYKAELNKKEYVSKTRFNTEFQMYQDLAEKNITMVYCAGEAVMISQGMLESEVEIEEFIKRFCDSINDAGITNRKYAPFISERIYTRYLLLEQSATEIFTLIKAWVQYRHGETHNFKISDTTYHSITEVTKAMIDKQKIISNDSDQLLRELRDYLSKLEVIE